jgi:hypothetical protein
VLKCLATSTAIWNPIALRANSVVVSGSGPNKQIAAKTVAIQKAYISILKALYLLFPFEVTNDLV